jgi:hypothetical protein
MKYLTEILFYLSWPATIAISYFAVMWAIKKLDKPVDEPVQPE